MRSARFLTALLALFVAGGAAGATLWHRTKSDAPPAAATETFSSEDFAGDSALVRAYSGSVELRRNLLLVLGDARTKLDSYPLATYRAVDLRDYLASRPVSEIGSGDHLVITNVRHERLYLTRADVENLRPQVVIAIDGERNLFRLFAAYRPTRRHSWIDEDTTLPWMTRPVGGLLLFPGRLPRRFPLLTAVPSGLTARSFRWQREDPLFLIRQLPDSLQDALTGASGCLHCHSLGEEGARAGHVLLESPAVRGGGEALALDDYPPHVLRAFLFEQKRVAEMFDVIPVFIPKRTAEQLDSLVGVVRGRGAPNVGARMPAPLRVP